MFYYVLCIIRIVCRQTVCLFLKLSSQTRQRWIKSKLWIGWAQKQVELKKQNNALWKKVQMWLKYGKNGERILNKKNKVVGTGLLTNYYSSSLFMSVGWDVKWCPVSMITTPMITYRKGLFSWLSKKSRLMRTARELQNFKTDHILITTTAFSLLKYRRYGEKHQPINQYELFKK